jgi:hypothetical protein
VHNNIKSLNINLILKDNDYFSHDIENSIQNYLYRITSNSKITESLFQTAFDELIMDLLSIFNNCTSLKYLSTYGSYYLQSKYRPHSTFVFKNINIHIKTECQSLQDFVVCVGEIKGPHVAISDKSAKGQILQYLQTLLTVQDRERIYGFLTNFTYITFFLC